ncbi:hypothetical protein Ae406Ps2_0503 [Pseudonocardia sp. Ae406_Ps2]|nr:hypothetical protein Ae406Ps2_0503 [Pseudonocardia sp. Ae406_Ps2]
MAEHCRRRARGGPMPVGAAVMHGAHQRVRGGHVTGRCV